MIGRTIKVLERAPRLVFSIFFPSSGGELVSGLDLYAPLTTNDHAEVKQWPWPVVLFSPGFGIERDMYHSVGLNVTDKQNDYYDYLDSLASKPKEMVGLDYTYVQFD